MSLTYQLILSRESIKFLKKQEKTVQLRINKAFKGLAIQPPIGDTLERRKGKIEIKNRDV